MPMKSSLMTHELTAMPNFHAGTWYQHDLGAAGGDDALSGDARAKTVVVGAGLAGLSTALGLAERGEHDILVVDRGGPAEGASGRNGGFVFGGFSLDNLELARQRGKTK